MSRNLKMPWSMEDTIENMEHIRDIVITKVRSINLDGKAEEDVREVNFDFGRVKEALNKQIPNKFVYPKDNREPYRCPSCNGDLGFTDDYFGDLEMTHFCRNCGQRLCK